MVWLNSLSPGVMQESIPSSSTDLPCNLGKITLLPLCAFISFLMLLFVLSVYIWALTDVQALSLTHGILHESSLPAGAKEACQKPRSCPSAPASCSPHNSGAVSGGKELPAPRFAQLELEEHLHLVPHLIRVNSLHDLTTLKVLCSRAHVSQKT